MVCASFGGGRRGRGRQRCRRRVRRAPPSPHTAGRAHLEARAEDRGGGVDEVGKLGRGGGSGLASGLASTLRGGRTPTPTCRPDGRPPHAAPRMGPGTVPEQPARPIGPLPSPCQQNRPRPPSARPAPAPARARASHLLLVALWRVVAVARRVDEVVGQVLPHAHRVQGVGDVVVAKLTRRLLGVPLRACAAGGGWGLTGLAVREQPRRERPNATGRRPERVLAGQPAPRGGGAQQAHRRSVPARQARAPRRRRAPPNRPATVPLRPRPHTPR
jgi:hypothetical protein